jgi:hypothetical protein
MTSAALDEKRNTAALTVQRFARGWLARCRAARLRAIKAERDAFLMALAAQRATEAAAQHRHACRSARVGGPSGWLAQATAGRWCTSCCLVLLIALGAQVYSPPLLPLHRREVERRTHPLSAADFQLLADELETWRKQQAAAIQAAAEQAAKSGQVWWWNI